MTTQDRTTLKSFFREGALPTAEHYRDLIDSSVNQVEDGFSKTVADGLRLSSLGSSRRVLSFYEGVGTPYPAWVMDHGDDNSLHLRPDRGGAAPAAVAGLTLTRDGRLGVHEAQPGCRMDVDGVVRMSGRMGRAILDDDAVPADGRWHDITPELTGCQAFEVMAGVGGEPGEGRYSMLHAVAMNAFHPRNGVLNWLFGRRPIRAQTAMYGRFADRIRLRWVPTALRHHFRLQIRANSSFGPDKVIRYSLTQLWFDPTMAGSRPPAAAETPK
ncbi:hypothetical protein SAMN05878503_10836 [Cereibacter ovatus]|uniref:Uncharacterized protein n=1 Tax=Cereibacter ovatus TaxID=439529 RepID=A0A285CVX0_9RHOB|nr:hypothetical protein [Cereibacter ovatus]SNX71083.1 hypothetical protein SAMN05878503_10836 [Cereibacter ovatus]